MLEEAGAYAIVLEMVPAELGKRVTDLLSIPTIGIGAGPHTAGQVLVCYDLLGMNDEFKPKFVKNYANLHDTISSAVTEYCADVREGRFPTGDHSF
jgi:3-methyl-2-oxobutanoate hydroxymethyltransferase